MSTKQKKKIKINKSSLRKFRSSDNIVIKVSRRIPVRLPRINVNQRSVSISIIVSKLRVESHPRALSKISPDSGFNRFARVQRARSNSWQKVPFTEF